MRKLRFQIKAAKLCEFIFATSKDEASKLAALKYPKLQVQILRYQI